jgi:hypothetical protein
VYSGSLKSSGQSGRPLNWRRTALQTNSDDPFIKSLRSDLQVRARFRRSKGCMYVAIYRGVHQQTVEKWRGNQYTMNNTSRFNWHSSAGFPRRCFLGGVACPLRRFLTGGVAPSPGESSTVSSCGSTSLPQWSGPDSILFEVDRVCNTIWFGMRSRSRRVSFGHTLTVAVQHVPTY